jgi:hypothetical protein
MLTLFGGGTLPLSFRLSTPWSPLFLRRAAGSDTCAAASKAAASLAAFRILLDILFQLVAQRERGTTQTESSTSEPPSPPVGGAMSLAMFMPLALVGGPRLPALQPALAATTRSAVRMYWHIFPRDGLDRDFNDPTRSSTMLRNEYNVEPGQHQALGRYDMIEYGGAVDISGSFDAIDPAQCLAVVAEDGSCVYVYAQGSQPTLWRTRPDEEWNWMQPGESVVLQSGHKVSLDCDYPDSAVYKFEKAGRFLVQEQGLDLQLPPGWITGVDGATGQKYYYNEQTGQSQWDVPRY